MNMPRRMPRGLAMKPRLRDLMQLWVRGRASTRASEILAINLIPILDSTGIIPFQIDNFPTAFKGGKEQSIPVDKRA